jgi:uncharacterized RDD family membrane protein YckC
MHNILDTEPDLLVCDNLNRRIIACLIDQIIVFVIVGIPLFVVRTVETMEGMQYVGEEVALLLFISVSWIYESAMISSAHQATFGKIAFGLSVTSLEGNRISFARSTGRFFCKYLPISYIGFFMAAFTRKRQALHDLIAGTLVLQD